VHHIDHVVEAVDAAEATTRLAIEIVPGLLDVAPGAL
jgi:hypothetical protein